MDEANSDRPEITAQYIADYILAVRDRGNFLAYADYEVIQNWLNLCDEPSELMIILDDFFSINETETLKNKKLVSLRKIAKKVEKLIVNKIRVKSKANKNITQVDKTDPVENNSSFYL